MKGVLVVGSATIDQIVQPQSTMTKVGGVVTYAGITFRRHGIETTVLTNMARGEVRITEVFRQSGIHLIQGASERTTIFLDHLDGDQRWQEMPACATPIRAGQILTAMKAVDHLHLGPLHPTDIDAGALEHLQDKRVEVSVDLQGYGRNIGGGCVSEADTETLRRAISVSRIVKANEDELESVLDVLKMRATELVATYGVRELVVTAGHLGGRVLTASGEEIKYSAATVDNVKDPTGAGDVFFAAYLAWRFGSRESVRDSCKHAALVAAQQVSGDYIAEESLLI